MPSAAEIKEQRFPNRRLNELYKQCVIPSPAAAGRGTSQLQIGLRKRKWASI